MQIEPGKASNDYLPALDGLRAVSILMVFFSHCNKATQKIFPGTLGVTIFFVLSGFLITRQMIVEIEANGRLNIKQFYWRRVLRLFPMLSLYLVIFVPTLIYLGASISVVQILSGVFYFANYYHIFIGYPPYNPMPILWSLAVEEHYYLLFPFFMVAFRKRLQGMLPLIIALLVVVPVWRTALYYMCLDHALPVCGVEGVIRTQATDTLFDCILYGVLAAMALHYYNASARNLLIHHKAFMIALLILLLSFVIRAPEFRATLRYSVQSACCAVIMINLLFGEMRWLRSLFVNGFMVFMGKLSYSLYLIHFGVLITIEAIEGSNNLNSSRDVLLYLVSSILLASGAYFLIEKPMAAIRRRQKRAI